MEEPQFSNVPNTYIPKGKCWKSRNVSIDAFIFALAPKSVNLGQMHIMVIKRSENMDVDPGKYGVPCGYLDWNETIYESMIREVYEETSLYLPKYSNQIIFDNNKQPFFIESRPNMPWNGRQNVGHHFVIVLDFSERNVDEFPFYVEDYTSSETSLVKWVPWYDFTINDLKWSFNHDRGIRDAMCFFMQGFANLEWFYNIHMTV